MNFTIVLPGQRPTMGDLISGETALEAVTIWADLERKAGRLKPTKLAAINIQGVRSHFRIELGADGAPRVLRAFR